MLIDPFYHYVIPTLAITTIFVLKSVLSDISVANPDLFLLPFI